MVHRQQEVALLPGGQVVECFAMLLAAGSSLVAVWASGEDPDFAVVPPLKLVD